MVMFKAKFRPLVADRPTARLQAQQQQQPQRRPRPQQAHEPQPVPPHPTQAPEAPPVEQERGPQYPVKEPGPAHEPERVA